MQFLTCLVKDSRCCAYKFELSKSFDGIEVLYKSNCASAVSELDMARSAFDAL